MRFNLREHLAVALSVTVLCLAILILVVWDRQAPITIERGEVLPHEVRAGNDIHIRITDYWHRRCTGMVYREVIGSDSIVHSYLPVRSRFSVDLEKQTIDLPLTLPAELPPGPAIVQSVVRFRECGFTSQWWPLVVVGPEIPFTVIE